jgi:hypothetical protein
VNIPYKYQLIKTTTKTKTTTTTSTAITSPKITIKTLNFYINLKIYKQKKTTTKKNKNVIIGGM